MVTTSLHVGDLFASYKDLEDKIERFKVENYVDLWKRDSRTIVAAKKRLNRKLNPELKYYKLTFCCINGGKTFNATGKGQRTALYVIRMYGYFIFVL